MQGHAYVELEMIFRSNANCSSSNFEFTQANCVMAVNYE